MAVTAQSPAPYTAGSVVIGLIRRYRERGLAAPVTAEVLARTGVVSDTLIPRTLPALISLELIDDTGNPTPTFQKMRTVPEADYKTCLAEWLRSVYADVFSFVDPSKDDPVRVRDAFRSYNPPGQQDRMVALFMALCAEAGIVAEGSKSEAKTITRRTVNTTRAWQTAPRPKAAVQGGNSGAATFGGNTLSLPPALTGILQSIPPPDKGWTQATRDKFVATFGTVLDFVVPIKAEPVTDQEDAP